MTRIEKSGGERLAAILKALEDMAAGQLDRRVDVGRIEIGKQHPTEPASAVEAATGVNQPDADVAGLSVLVADDNEDLLSTLSELLQRCGCNVETAKNGVDALNCVSSSHFDVILMDLQMPVLDGLEATRRMRQMGFKGPILAVSALALTDKRKLSLAAGCTDHVEKPIDVKKLAALLARYRSKKK